MSDVAPREAFLLRLIGAGKLVSAVLLVLAGFGIFRMVDRDLGTSLEHYASRLHLDPDNRYIHEAIENVSDLSPARLKAIGAGTFVYALLHVIEGTGLLLLRRWAEYVTVVITGSLLPLEAYEIAQKHSAVRIAVMAVNLVVLIYLIVKLVQHRKRRPVPSAAAPS